MGGSERTPPQGGPSQADIDARLYKVLLDLEVRLDSKFEKSREQTKEDIRMAVAIGVGPLDAKIERVATQVAVANGNVATILERLQDGDDRFKEQSSRISRALEAANTAKAEATEAKMQMVSASGRGLPLQPAEAKEESGSKISFKEVIALIGAIGGLFGIVLGSVALSRTGAQPAPTAVTAPATPGTTPP